MSVFSVLERKLLLWVKTQTYVGSNAKNSFLERIVTKKELRRWESATRRTFLCRLHPVWFPHPQRQKLRQDTWLWIKNVHLNLLLRLHAPNSLLFYTEIIWKRGFTTNELTDRQTSVHQGPFLTPKPPKRIKYCTLYATNVKRDGKSDNLSLFSFILLFSSSSTSLLNVVNVPNHSFPWPWTIKSTIQLLNLCGLYERKSDRNRGQGNVHD